MFIFALNFTITLVTIWKTAHPNAQCYNRVCSFCWDTYSREFSYQFSALYCNCLIIYMFAVHSYGVATQEIFFKIAQNNRAKNYILFFEYTIYWCTKKNWIFSVRKNLFLAFIAEDCGPNWSLVQDKSGNFRFLKLVFLYIYHAMNSFFAPWRQECCSSIMAGSLQCPYIYVYINHYSTQKP